MPMTPIRAAAFASAIGLAALAGALGAGGLWPARSARISPVRSDAPAVAEGRGYFVMSCAHCHADDASGDEGPDLRKLHLSDAHITLLVKSGIKGDMPSFAKKYDDAQIAAVVAYLRSLPVPP